MKFIKNMIIISLILGFVYTVCMVYLDRIERIENGEMIQVSESYMDR